MQDGTLVTGPGIRHLLGVTGDDPTITLLQPPSDIGNSYDFKHIFIQSREVGRKLQCGTNYLFCK